MHPECSLCISAAPVDSTVGTSRENISSSIPSPIKRCIVTVGIHIRHVECAAIGSQWVGKPTAGKLGLIATVVGISIATNTTTAGARSSTNVN